MKGLRLREMRVGVDGRTALARTPRGEGKTTFRLYSELAAMRPDWHFFMYCQRCDASPFRTFSNVTVRCVDVPGDRYAIWEDWALPALAMRDKIDVLHCTSSTAPRWRRTAVVTTVHDLIPLVFDEGWPPAKVAAWRRGVERAVKLSSRIIAVSRSTRDDLIRQLGVEEGLIDVINWGCDLPAAKAGTGDAGSAPPTSHVLAFGGLAARKNLLRMMESFAILSSRVDVRFEVVGLPQESHMAALSAYRAAGGHPSQLNLLSYVTESELTRLYSGASALFYPSLYEGFGMPLVEAMAYRLPIIASDRSSIPEVVGDAAVLTDPLDPAAMARDLERVLVDPQLAEALSAAAGRRATELTWRSCAEKTAAVLEAAAR